MLNYIANLDYVQAMVSCQSNIKCPLHIHRDMETIIVTDGTLHMLIGKTPYAITPGCAVFIEPFTPHSFSDEEAHICYVIEHSPDITPVFYDWLKKHYTDDCLLRLTSGLYDYIRSALPYKEFHRGVSVMSAQAILMPLYNEFAELGHFKYGEDKFDDLYLDALDYISKNLDGDLSVVSVSKRLYVRPETLCRKFAEKANMTLHEYVQYLRVCKACSMLKRGDSISNIALDVGFGSIRTFNRIFRRIIGVTPTEFINDASSDIFFNQTWDLKGLYNPTV